MGRKKTPTQTPSQIKQRPNPGNLTTTVTVLLVQLLLGNLGRLGDKDKRPSTKLYKKNKHFGQEKNETKT